MLKNQTISKFLRDNILYIVSTFLLVFSIYYFYNNTYKNNKVDKKIKSQLEKDSLLYRDPDENDYYKIYSTSSKVTVINYISLDCPYCRSAYLMEDKLKNNYEGKVNIIYRHNPLDVQPLSPEKALISECVREQSSNKVFFEFISYTFSNFDKINKDNNWLKKIAINYINSEEVFNNCLKDLSIKNKIQVQKNENILANITYTPTLLVFIDGKFVKKFENLGSSQVIKILDFYSKI